jgi:acylphosphatase
MACLIEGFTANIILGKSLTAASERSRRWSLMRRERRRVLFSGRVQGVGFRYTCQSLAARFEVSGYVRNLADGRVELVSEGDSVEIDRFLAAIQAEMGHYIREIQTESDSPGDNPLSGFSIRH